MGGDDLIKENKLFLPCCEIKRQICYSIPQSGVAEKP